MNQCKCEPFENASVIKTLNPIRRPSFSCLLTSSGPFLFPRKSTFLVVVYIRWNDQGHAFTAVITCTDAHRSISSNRLVCIASVATYTKYFTLKINASSVALLHPCSCQCKRKCQTNIVYHFYMVYIWLQLSL